MPPPARILILGGHGKVALYLTPLLLSRNHHVTSLIHNPGQEKEILACKKGSGSLDVLVSSLDNVRSVENARSILDVVKPDYVVWAAGACLPVYTSCCLLDFCLYGKRNKYANRNVFTGAGGKGAPSRTIQIDQNAAKHFIAASLLCRNGSTKVSKFLLISHLGSRRNKPAWFSDEQWRFIEKFNKDVLPVYYGAKLDADEYLTALTALKSKKDGSPFQTILLRPGMLSDEPALGKVQLGKTKGAKGSVSREDVAKVADALLERDDTRGWFDLLGGDEEIEHAVKRVVSENVDAVDGEDVEAMIQHFSL